MKCTKEKELAELQTNMEWIKNNLKEIAPKINNMHDTFLQGEGKISRLNKTIYGNGKSGIVDDVKEIKQTLNEYTAMGKLAKWLIGLLSTANVSALAGLFYLLIK